MVWCKFCAKNCPPVRLEDSFICCGTCGKVVEYDNFSSEPTFFKNAAGQSQLSGNFVRTVQSTISASRERTLSRARTDMDFMVTTLGMSGGDSLVNQGLALYTIAIERNFTKGRRAEQVEAACLYIACRVNKKPFLLIDFSDYLKINVYVLGAVFLQLCKLLSLEEHPIVQKPVDPSLFIHRFTAGLPGGTNMVVSRTALRIISSMKRDWMQTGRKPSGLCGAALYISALSHGLTCSKLDIIKIVHICEATLTKRLLEFEDTESGGLTLQEFNLRAEELEKLSPKESYTGSEQSAVCMLLCEHKGSSRPSFAHGLCEECYDDFITISGGLDGGSDPPAFQQAESERMAQASLEEISCLKKKQNLLNNSVAKRRHMLNTGSTEQDDRTEQNGPDKTDLHGQRSSDESEGISDIDDIEIDSYLHNEEEKYFKKIIWEELNKEYVQEQAAKEAAAAAAREALQASFSGSPEEFEAAQELAAAAAAAVAKSRKEKQQKRAAEAKNTAPARTAAEATRQMLTKKRLSSKVNYDVLEKLFEDPDVSENPKKSRTEISEDEKHTRIPNGSKDENLEESYNNLQEPGLADEWGDDAYAKQVYESDGYEDYGYCGMEDEYSTY